MSKTTVITLRISLDLQEQIRAIAQKEEIPASYIIRRLIKSGLNAEAKPHIKSTSPAIPEWE